MPLRIIICQKRTITQNQGQAGFFGSSIDPTDTCACKQIVKIEDLCLDGLEERSEGPMLMEDIRYEPVMDNELFNMSRFLNNNICLL